MESDLEVQDQNRRKVRRYGAKSQDFDWANLNSD